jgi:hypothetical protein
MTRDEDALDRRIDDLLAGGADGPARARDIDPGLDRTARVMSVALARFHPSFRFEERLATRLRLAADGHDMDSRTEAPHEPGVVIPFATPRQPARSRSRRVNGALIGGAISAGVSIASIAAGLVARRRGRGDGPWERVV